MQALLTIENLQIRFHTHAGTIYAVNGIDLSLQASEIIAIVGESGCGKSATANAILGLVPSPPGEIAAGSIRFDGRDLTRLDAESYRKLRGSEISMIFQDPMTALNPVLTIGLQISEMFLTHQEISQADARSKSIEMLTRVGIPAPETRLDQYPHELSGGMRQRVMIAMALACQPRILIADEPTTALDVTIQAQIIELMKSMNQQLATSIILITHDLGIVAGLCHRALVMYAGQIIEEAPVAELYSNPHHPYTWGLLNSVPRLDRTAARLTSIAGQPPDLLAPPSACSFLNRCPYAMQICQNQPPVFAIDPTHRCRCWLSHPDSPRQPINLFQGGRRK